MNPSKLGRYKVIEAIGKGAMGVVHRGFDPRIGREVALKTVRIDVPPDDPQFKDFMRRFYREVQAAGNLLHPNIITIYDFDEDDGVPFIAMELATGTDLATVIKSKTEFTPEIVIKVVSQIANGLDYAHQQGIIHRDIKPANVMVGDDWNVKIMDFSVAKIKSSSITRTGSIIGTPSYMSPEQITGDKIDGASDQFSLAVVAYELLTGRKPFPGKTITEILNNIVINDPRDADRLRDGAPVPEAWKNVIGKALSKKSADRFSSCAEFAEALEEMLRATIEDTTAPIVQSEPSPQAAPSPTDTVPLAESVTDEPPELPTKEMPEAASPPPEPRPHEPAASPPPPSQPPVGSMGEPAAESLSPQTVKSSSKTMTITIIFIVIILVMVAIWLFRGAFASLPEFSGSAQPPPTPVAQATSKPTADPVLLISTVPSDAEVWIDGHFMGTTGGEQFRLRPPPGKFTLRVSQPGYGDFSTEMIASTQQSIQPLHIELQPRSANATPRPTQTVASPPKPPGRSPTKAEPRAVPPSPAPKSIAPTAVPIVAAKPTSAPPRSPTSPPPKRIVRIEDTPNQPTQPPEGRALLSVRSNPSGAEVYLDGTFIGRTPLERISVVPGPHRCQLELEGHQSFQTIFTASEKRPKEVTVDLPVKPAPLRRSPPPKPLPINPGK